MTVIQYMALILSVVGAFFVQWSLFHILIAVFFFYLYGIIGMSLMLHRFWSHRSFKFKSRLVEKIFTFISIISARGSPIAWVHIHRTHHKFSDTVDDPHKPSDFSLFSFKTTTISKLNIFLIKDLMTPEQKRIHENYLLYLALWIFLLFCINLQFIYFAWILPIVLNQISQDLWNYFSHTGGGYRNFETNDNSKNVTWLFPLILGETWHNNHHKNSGSFTTTVKRYEFDPLKYLILIVKE